MFEQLNRPNLQGLLPEPLQRVWVLGVVVLNIILVGIAIYLETNGLNSEAGITMTIALFTILYTAVVYAVVWWMKQV
ncbi:hypothetical protein [Halorussus salinisoli]|uniref:hypothetical protein n=1 Tax=Halorussus salinisoli TaxID=2558242 RepID=UPI0010C160E8|nr:hypothetical protein [Halorussus salinisoli]